MFIHIFTYRLKCLIRDKELVFWTLMFPLILATFFNLAFSNLNDSEAFNPIDIAVVENEAYYQNEGFQEILKAVSNGEDRLFNLTLTSEATAAELLKKDEVASYIILNPKMQMFVRQSGINENIIKIFLEQYNQTTAAATTVFANTTQMEKVLSDLSERLEYTKEIPLTSANPNIVLNYFYSLIAMACMYGSFWGLKQVMDIQADLSTRASRLNMSPVHKLKSFIYSLSAALVIQYVEILVLLGYLRFFLGIDFGTKTGYVLLTSFIGSIVGITFGAFVSATVKKGEGIKVAILIGTSMLGSFLSGMMFDKMKYIVAQKAPLLSYMNPVNLLTDAFYCLYYYDTFKRYWLNVGVLGLFALFFSLGTYMIIRRQKYASL